MTYVPTTVVVAQRQASLEAQDLARHIENLIVDYRRENPRVRDEDVDAAMKIAATRAGASASRVAAPMILGVVAVLSAVFVLLALFLSRSAG